MSEADITFWATQSPVTDPAAAVAAFAELPADPDALADICSQLVFHYRADGDWEENGIETSRASEINLCYVADMVPRLVELQPSLSAPRNPAQRILGCCRDFSTLFASMLRHHGLPARTRVGFANYFMTGWWLDHVVVEVWEGRRWRMIDPELTADFTADDKGPLNRRDLGPDRFLTGPQAWQAARSGAIDADHVVVHPELEIPATRGWTQLGHNLVHDTATLNKTELLLWDEWCPWLVDAEVLPAGAAEAFDALAAATADPGVAVAVVKAWGFDERLRVPETIVRVDPMSNQFSEIGTSRALGS